MEPVHFIFRLAYHVPFACFYVLSALLFIHKQTQDMSVSHDAFTDCNKEHYVLMTRVGS